MRDNSFVSAIYFHPEAFPPTLNATDELSKIFDTVYLLYRPHLTNEWNFDSNVRLVASGEKMSVQRQEHSSIYKKAIFFLGFTRKLYLLIKKHRPKVVLLYDAIPLFSYYLVKKIIRHPPIVWYHNHDVADKSGLNKFSIGWFSASFEHKMFPYIDIFSLPSEERKQYFPMDLLKGKYFFLPNLPSWKFYGQFKGVHKDQLSIRVLFQGSIGPGHGIEELMNLMPFNISGKPVKLVLKGFLKEPFKIILNKIIDERSLRDNVEIHGVTSYKEVPRLTSSCHIGIAVFTKADIMNKTLGTASNKIYEYAACGLPVLYYESEHYSRHLSNYKWAVPTDLSPNSLTKSIEYIDANYTDLSIAARSDFETKLKFEIVFKNLSEELTQYI